MNTQSDLLYVRSEIPEATGLLFRMQHESKPDEWDVVDPA